MSATPLPPAQVYEHRFVPALFGPWGARITTLAGVQAGHHVLDVACGTGALTRAVATQVGGAGRVAGLDLNPDMLAVARQLPHAVEWAQGDAAALPYPSGSFDRVVSQFGYMFFPEPAASLAEMARVLRPDGRLAVAVCDAIDHSPGYAVLAELLHRLFGPAVAEAFRAPFQAGDPARLQRDARAAGLSEVTVHRLEGAARFASIADLVSTERACAWTLGGLLDDAQFERLAQAAEVSLAPFADASGAVAVDMPVLVLTARP